MDHLDFDLMIVVVTVDTYFTSLLMRVHDFLRRWSVEVFNVDGHNNKYNFCA